MKTVTTQHPQIGYAYNVEIIETALRESFGIQDNSSLMEALATTIWLDLAVTPKEDHTWGTAEISEAIGILTYRLKAINKQITAAQISL